MDELQREDGSLTLTHTDLFSLSLCRELLRVKKYAAGESAALAAGLMQKSVQTASTT